MRAMPSLGQVDKDMKKNVHAMHQSFCSVACAGADQTEVTVKHMLGVHRGRFTSLWGL